MSRYAVSCRNYARWQKLISILQHAGLYRGYKRRNAELDVLSENLPPYYKEKKGSVVSQEYADIADEATLKSLHSYLFKKYQLLDSVIRARKTHHSHL
jgi:hypothetical protein